MKLTWLDMVYSMTKIIYFGNERLVSGLEKSDTPILRGLIDKGYEVVAIVSHYSDSNSRNKRELEVASVAKEFDIPLFLPKNPSEILNDLKTFNADIAILVAYGRIISQKVIDIFPLGIINVHPSLLPKYRGPTPVESALLNGDHETGVSIMKLSAGMDEGPVYAQAKVSIKDDEGKFSLYEKIVNTSTQLFFDCLPKIIEGSLEPIEQNNTEATFSKLIKKSDGILDWNKTAQQLTNEIRAFTGWPQSRAKLADIDVIVTQASSIKDSSSDSGLIEITDQNCLTIGTSDGKLCIKRLKPLGKKEMPITAFLAGYRSKIQT